MTGVGVVKPREMGHNANSMPTADIGRLVMGLQQYMPYETAQRLLHERAKSLTRSGEYPGGRIEVRGDVAVLTEMAHSGGEEPLCWIKERGGGYVIEGYTADLPNPLYN